MPVDEGEALHDTVPPPPPSRGRCWRSAATAASPSSTSAPPPGSGAGAVLGRPPPWLRGEPAWLGVARATWSTRRSARWTPCPCSAARSTTPASRARWSRSSATRRPSAAHWRTPLRCLFIDGDEDEPARLDYETGWHVEECPDPDWRPPPVIHDVLPKTRHRRRRPPSHEQILPRRLRAAGRRTPRRRLARAPSETSPRGDGRRATRVNG